MKKVLADGTFANMTEKEIVDDLDASIKHYAGVDVQILHRFAFNAVYSLLPSSESASIVIKIYDRYLEENLDKTFFSFAEALGYLRSVYKSDLEEGEYYDVIKKKDEPSKSLESESEPEPEPKPAKIKTEKKSTVAVSKKDFHVIKDYLDMDSLSGGSGSIIAKMFGGATMKEAFEDYLEELKEDWRGEEE